MSSSDVSFRRSVLSRLLRNIYINAYRYWSAYEGQVDAIEAGAQTNTKYRG